MYDFLTSAAARLASSVEASALELAPSVVGALAGVLTQDGVEEKVRRKVAQALTGLERAPKAWVDALGLLGEQEKVAVRSLLGLP